MPKPFTALVLLLAAAGGEVSAAPGPGKLEERRVFRRDRDVCRSVAERAVPYVDPRRADLVTRRQLDVEADTQRCMLSRGWNDPTFDGWAAGRSWGRSR